jgi:rhodanese-related sulfurtransferase
VAKKYKSTKPNPAGRKAQSRRKEALPRSIPWFSIGILTVVFVSLTGLFFYRYFAPRSLPDEISVQAAHQKYQQDAYLLDVREQEEWDEYHIPGATLIPLGELAARVNEVPQDKEIVVVCRSGNRSEEGRDILRKAGLSNVTSMAGGMIDWRAAGFPVETGP